MVQSRLFLLTSLIDWPPAQQPVLTNWKCVEQFLLLVTRQHQILPPIGPVEWWPWEVRDYLEPWCKNPKQSWALEVYLKYLPVPASLRNKRISFSANLEAANNTPAPWSRKSGEKRTRSGMFLAPAGVPWNTKSLSANKRIPSSNHDHKSILQVPLNAYKGELGNQLKEFS